MPGLRPVLIAHMSEHTGTDEYAVFGRLHDGSAALTDKDGMLWHTTPLRTRVRIAFGTPCGSWQTRLFELP